MFTNQLENPLPKLRLCLYNAAADEKRIEIEKLHGDVKQGGQGDCLLLKDQSGHFIAAFTERTDSLGSLATCLLNLPERVSRIFSEKIREQIVLDTHERSPRLRVPFAPTVALGHRLVSFKQTEGWEDNVTGLGCESSGSDYQLPIHHDTSAEARSHCRRHGGGPWILSEFHSVAMEGRSVPIISVHCRQIDGLLKGCANGE